jgi:glycerol-3-phosphate dehydrogenase
MNVKAAVIRKGFLEISALSKRFFGGAEGTMSEAAGIGDLILTLTFGRGRRLAAAFVKVRFTVIKWG